jgi:hypothetical protein
VKTDRKWRVNVAAVAFPIWMQAASELPKCPTESEVAHFLNDWSERKYTDQYANGLQEKRFGVARATTLLHFLSGGRLPHLRFPRKEGNEAGTEYTRFQNGRLVPGFILAVLLSGRRYVRDNRIPQR